MRPGDLVANRYRLGSEIGAAHFSRVFLASDVQLARQVVVKAFLLPEFDGLLGSIAKSATFTHPGALTILDTGIDRYPYVVTEYCPGGNLGDEIAAMGPLGNERVTEIALGACEVLSAAHAEGLLHLGMKPNNVLFDGIDQMRISDFGLSMDDGEITLGPGLLPAYVAPEQVSGESLTPATDLFSLGVVLAEAVAGERVVAGRFGVAIQGESAYRPNRAFECDGSLRSAIEKATRRDPRDRFSSAVEMAASIRREEGALLSGNRARRDSLQVGGAGLPVPAAVGLLDRPTDEEVTSDFAWPEAVPPERPSPIGDLTDVDEFWDEPDGGEETSVPATSDAEPRSRRHFRKWAAYIALIALVSVVAVVALPAATRRAPDLLGMTLDGARTELKSAHVGDEVVATQPSSAYPKGTVIGQSPPPGVRVGFGRHIRLTLSSGPPPVSVPQVKGMTIEQASAALGGVRLVAVVVGTARSADDPGKVLSQEPSGTMAEVGTSVNLTVSSGPEPATVPDLAGKALKDAEAALAGIGSGLVQTQENSDTVKAGTVISTSPSPGVKIRSGHPVTLVVSKGPRMIPVPDVRGSRVTDATARLQALGFTVKLVQIVGQDRVVAQDPAPGAQAKKGQTVTLTTGP